MFAPFVTLFAIVIYVQSGEFPFYLQKRSLTLEKRHFNVIKLKTLYSKNKAKVVNTVFIKSELHKYLIPFGKFLRRTGLDELPQLINVIKGEMSLIGPRPLMESDLVAIKNNAPELYSLRNNLNCKPGITGYWQVFGNRLNGVADLIGCDLLYAQNKSFLFDLKVLLKTIPLVLFAAHADAISFRDKFKISDIELIKTVQPSDQI